jgi:amidase
VTVRTFYPSHYHLTIGSHDPVLHIGDGDTVVTTTVDSGGHDERGAGVTPGGNPQTGPFYVDDAEPGDVLAVHLDELTPNRDTAYSAATLAAHVVDPEAVRDIPVNPRSEWTIDRDQGRATLATPSVTRRNLSLPLAPMLGCFGVAPEQGQALSTATSGKHGGNMDYRGFTAGVTVYFPVFVPGALFHLGDGHALQGDGEIVGTGLEISFDVRFTVRLLKEKHIGWPRGENEDYIFTVGNARPLDQAVQHATTEMYRWLTGEYGFDSVAASLLLGQCVEYDLANMFDPAYTMVCKMPKGVLQE